MAAKKKPKKAGSGKLTKADLKKIKEALLSQRARLTGDMDSLKEDALRPGDQDFSVDHMADHASDNFDQDFNLGLIENVGRTVNEIDDALKRLESAGFGTCAACKVQVPKARLEYIPWAKYCVECQTKAENGQLLDIQEDEG